MNTIRWEMSAEAIEQESFRLIEQEYGSHEHLPPEEWRVIRRLIHTTADISIADSLYLHDSPVTAGLAALRSGCNIICDSSMIRSGLSLPRLQKVFPQYTNENIVCCIHDADVIARARHEGRTRALCAAEKVRPLLEGSIVLVGNAPLALARIARYILEENVRPALVIAMPVGFVNVIESKALIMRCSVPQIVLNGRRGGSALAVATLHAITENA